MNGICTVVCVCVRVCVNLDVTVRCAQGERIGSAGGGHVCGVVYMYTQEGEHVVPTFRIGHKFSHLCTRSLHDVCSYATTRTQVPHCACATVAAQACCQCVDLLHVAQGSSFVHAHIQSVDAAVLGGHVTNRAWGGRAFISIFISSFSFLLSRLQ